MTEHTCDSNGPVIHITASGKIIHWHTFRAWASYTDQLRDELIVKHQNEIEDPVVGSSVTCSMCGAGFQMPNK